MSDVNVP